MNSRGFPPVTLARSELRCFTADGCAESAVAGADEWSVFIAWPDEPAPPAGHPVLYLMDANASFATLVESVRARARRTSSTGVMPAVVVGIGYPVHAPRPRERRVYDLTEAPPVVPAAERAGRAGDATSFGRTGGAPRLREFLTGTLIPAIERDFPVDRTRAALIGHSLAGLFVLETLFADPGAFGSYVAISPSVWWNRDRVFAGADAVAASGAESSVLLSAGEYERALAPWQRRGDPAELAALRTRRRERRMLDDTAEVVARLVASKSSRVRARHDIIAGEDHGSVVPVALGRALRVVLAPR